MPNIMPSLYYPRISFFFFLPPPPSEKETAVWVSHEKIKLVF